MWAFPIGDMDVGVDLQLALDACQRREGVDHWTFTIRAIEYLAQWPALRAAEPTRDYLAALSQWAAAQSETEARAAEVAVANARERLLFAIRDIPGKSQ